LLPALRAALPPGRVRARPIDLAAYASDASVYRIVPRAVVAPHDVAEVRATLEVAHAHRVPITFRAAGTSLSGQAVGPGVIVDVSRGWKRVEVGLGGARVRVEPGVIGGHVNALLRPFGRRLGPDPASIDACMLGGILANNSSGMCCGVSENAYHTLEAMTVVLADGLVVDTARPERLRADAPDLVRGLLDLRARLLARPDLVERVRTRRSIKNTTGYALDALLDHPEPADALAHLMIGSEGTLGFIAEAVLATVPDPPCRLTALLLFASVPAAAAAVDAIAAAGARAVELLDRACLRAVASRPGVPPGLDDVGPAAAALLVEWACADEAGLESAHATAAPLLARLPLLRPAALVSDARERAALWAVRKGVFPAVGAARAPGTAVVIEDVAFPPGHLAAGTLGLQAILREHGWDEAVVFGHAKDGNLHFVLTPRLDDPTHVRRYDAFMRALVRLVLEHEGSLKAEHGTGRNMAPFVREAWGDELHDLMRDVKRLLDPRGLLNPGVVLTDDATAHLRHLKDLPGVSPLVDRCIECGFCEPVCPSRRLTLTPRQRIVVRRELTRARSDPEVERDWAFDGLDSCAGDGMCATACPVEIDTGELVRELRAEARGPLARSLAVSLAGHLGALERGARGALHLADLAADVVGAGTLVALTSLGSRALGRRLPAFSAGLPRAGRPPLAAAPLDAELIYFATCTSRVLGAPRGEPAATGSETFLRVAARAGVGVRAPALPGRCCGLPFAAKGFPEARARALRDLVRALWRASDGGRLRVVVDASSCAQALRAPDAGAALSDPRDRARWRQLRVLHPAEALRELLPRLTVTPRRDRVAVHPTCGARKLGADGTLLQVARACAPDARAPLALSCCGAAGDRGLLVPELPLAALELERAELLRGGFSAFYADNPACEAGLRAATGLPFRSFVHLVEETTRGGPA
jgi:D-lactate dehydrogenase